MAGLTALRDGLKTRLDTITGLSAYARRPKTVNLPAAIVTAESITYDATMARGADDFVFLVTVVVADPVSDIGEDALDDYCDGASGKSVKAAIEADGTLGGLASFAVVVGVRDFGDFDIGGVPYLGCQFVVQVTASGT